MHFNVLAGLSRPKDGVASLAYVPVIHVFMHCRQGVDARDKRAGMTGPEILASTAVPEIKFSNYGTIRLEIAIAGLLPSVIVLRTPVSKNETSSGGVAARRSAGSQ